MLVLALFIGVLCFHFVFIVTSGFYSGSPTEMSSAQLENKKFAFGFDLQSFTHFKQSATLINSELS